jgi:hypothetical protein
MKARRILELTVLYPGAALLIVAGLGVAVPDFYCHSGQFAKATAAVATLRNIVSAQEQFRDRVAVDLDHDGRPEYGSFLEFTGVGYLRADPTMGRLDPPVLSNAFGRPGDRGEVLRSGYYFRIYLPGADGAAVSPDSRVTGYERVNADLAENLWCVYAWPKVITEHQCRILFANQEGVIRTAPLERELGRIGPATVEWTPKDESGHPWPELP